MVTCECRDPHPRRRVVLTGGPGAGKTAILELIRQSFCEHVIVLPESASIVFGGGFPRGADVVCQQAAQRAIFYLQREIETAADAENPVVVLCDRGTVDGAAYWLGKPDFWLSVGTTLDEQLHRYDAVIHLRTPAAGDGYNHRNPLRVETAAEALRLDALVARAWDRHPRRFFVEASSDFLDKAAHALEILRRELPECCRAHVVPVVDERSRTPSSHLTIHAAV